MSSRRTQSPLWRIAPWITSALVVACSGASTPSQAAPTSTPAAETAGPQHSVTPGGTTGPSSDVAAVEHCGASTDYQLHYTMPGMEASQVSCGRSYKQVEGIEATFDVYLPPGTGNAAQLPVVVFVHGNGGLADPTEPIRDHWKRDGYTNGLIAAASGWAGITFDYRGYSIEDPVRLEAAQQDVLDLLAYLDDHADELRLDPTRICLWASSGGGLPVAWAAMRGEPRPRCVVTFSAGFELGPGSQLAARDPAALIDAGQPPFFIARGRRDAFAYEGSMRFVERAVEAGAEIVVEDHP